MSDHRIEDLVEDSLRLLLASGIPSKQKIAFAHDLYAFQHRFDTSDTYGRLQRELAEIGFDKNAPHLNRPCLEIITDIMALADKAGDRRLIHHWLAVLATELDERTLIDADLPEDYTRFRDRAATIREIALRHAVHGWRGKGYIKLPGWNTMARSYDRNNPLHVELRSMLRFLLDHKNTADKIRTGYEKEKAVIARIAQSPFHDLPALLEARGNFRFAGKAKTRDTCRFIFEAGSAGPDAHIYLCILHDLSLNCLIVTIGTRLQSLSDWQGTGFAADDTPMHFERSITDYMPEEILDADKNLGTFGWKYRLDQSEKILLQRLDTIIAAWKYRKPFVDFHTMPLRDRIAEEGFAVMAAKREERRSSFGFFANEIDMLFACACHSWEQGIKPADEIAAIHDWLLHIHPSAGEKRTGRIRALRALETGTAFPPSLPPLPFRRHDTEFPL